MATPIHSSVTSMQFDIQLLSEPVLIVSSLFVALIAIAILVFISRRKSQSQGNALLLVGPSDSGKTALFTSLVYNQTVPTHTSLQANSSFITIPGKKNPVRVIDIPGHPRIRGQFNDYLAETKAIVFVVDANTVSRNGAVVAEHLHLVMDTLMSLPPSHYMPSLLILAHKTDLLKASTTSADTTSLAVNRVQTVLERELEKRRASYSGGMGVEALGSEDEKSSMGGLDCTGTDPTFRFANWDGGEVLFLGTSVKNSNLKSEDEKAMNSGLTSLIDWIVEYL